MPILCERCGEAVRDGDYMTYDGKAVCEECYNTIHDVETQLKFVIDHPRLVIEYLQETLYAPAPYGTRAKEIVDDMCHWSDTCVNPDDHEYMRYSDWIMRWW
ncbi:MAG: hypothetical protein IIZ19_07110 [Clostridia bacterium]|nr:hypothetical protein [Clostridia bacterium]